MRRRPHRAAVQIRFSLSVPLRFSVRVFATLLLAIAAAGACLALHTPLPWMIGPLLAVSVASIAGAPTASHTPLRNAGQWVIGVALGLYFTPHVVTLVAGVWWAIVLAIVWALLLGWAFGRWLQWLHADRMPHVPTHSLRATTYFAGAIGGASEMTLLAERVGARTDLVAAAHSLRLVLVTIAVPFAMQWSGLHGLEINVSAVPVWLSNAAQLVIAVSLGVRFSREFLHTAPRWLATVSLGTLVMIALCGAFAWLLAWGTGLHPATLIPGTSPGGIAEMAITAKVLQLGVPVVTAFQVCRLVAVLLIVGPMYAQLYGKRRSAQ